MTIAQFPNWPLFVIAFGWLVRALAGNGSTVYDVAGGIVTVLWLYWGAGELLRGVNPWRRLLGAAVIAWQTIRLAT